MRASSVDSSMKETAGWRGPHYPRGQDRRPSAPELSGTQGRREATANLRGNATSQNERTSKRNSFFFTGAEMLPAILKDLTKAERTIDVF